MKTGAEIVAELESIEDAEKIAATLVHYWPTIRAALMEYEPKSALSTLMDRWEATADGDAILRATPDEIAAAREELDQIERERDATK